MKPLYEANMVAEIWALRLENAELKELNEHLLQLLDGYTDKVFEGWEREQ